MKINSIIFSLITISLYVSVISCKRNKDDDSKSISYFTRKDFSESSILKADTIRFDKSVYPTRFYIFRDTLLFVLSKKGVKNLGEIYHLKTMDIVAKCLPKGKGPNEFINVNIKHTENNNEFLIHDIVTKNIAICNIDSIIKYGLAYKISKIKVPQNIHNTYVLGNNKFIGNNSYYFDYLQYSNNVDQLFIFNEKGPSSAPIGKGKYFVANISNCNITSSPQKKIILTADYRTDKIIFYDYNLNIVKTLIGPDNIEIDELRITNDHVRFEKGKYYRSYYPLFSTEKSIYLIYCGHNGIDQKEYLYDKKVEVFKIDWNGNLIHRYQLDKYLLNISVDSNEKYLYGTVKNKLGEYELYYYKLQ